MRSVIELVRGDDGGEKPPQSAPGIVDFEESYKQFWPLAGRNDIADNFY